MMLLDLPGLLFFSTYTLLVLFWAEIFHQVMLFGSQRSLTNYSSQDIFKGIMLDCSSIIFLVEESLTILIIFIIDQVLLIAYYFSQARNLPIDKLRPAYYAINAVVYFIQVVHQSSIYIIEKYVHA